MPVGSGGRSQTVRHWYFLFRPPEKLRLTEVQTLVIAHKPRLTADEKKGIGKIFFSSLDGDLAAVKCDAKRTYVPSCPSVKGTNPLSILYAIIFRLYRKILGTKGHEAKERRWSEW